jgi:flagellar basal body-associated protein FliL
MEQSHRPQTEQEDSAEILEGVRGIQAEQGRVAKSVNIPLVVLIVAFIGGLIGLGAWNRDIEQRKADRSEVVAVKAETQQTLSEIRDDVKFLIRIHVKAKGTE